MFLTEMTSGMIYEKSPNDFSKTLKIQKGSNPPVLHPLPPLIHKPLSVKRSNKHFHNTSIIDQKIFAVFLYKLFENIALFSHNNNL